MDTISLYIFHGARFLGLISLIYVVIYLYAKVRQKKLDFALLFEGVLGSILLLAIGNALIKTSGLTILLVFIPLLIYFGYLNHEKQESTIENLSIRSFLAFLGISSFFFSWAFFSLHNFTDQGLYIPSGLATQANDFFIYVQRSKFLGETGQENFFGLLNQLDSSYQGLSPYHYLELWLGNALSQILGISHVYSMGLVVKPLFYLCSATGLLALLSHTNKILKPIHFLLAIVLFFVSAIYIKTPLINLAEFNLSMLSYRFKMITYYPFVIGFVLMMLKDRERSAFLFLAGLMISSIVAIPAFLGGSILYVFSKKLRKQSIDFAPLLILLISTLAMGAFYFLTPSPSLQSSLGVEQEEIFSVINIKSLPGLILAFFSNLGNLIVVFFSSILLILGLWVKSSILSHQVKEVILYFLCSVLAGAFSYAMLKDFENSIQLFFNPSIVVLNISVVLLIILMFRDSSLRKWAFMLVGISLVNQMYILSPKLFQHHTRSAYSSSYLNRIEELAEQGKLSAIGGVLKEAEDYTSSFSKITYAYTGGYYLLYFSGEISCISMSDHQVPISAENERNNLVNRNSGYFYQFVEQQKQQDDFQSISQSQLRFIQKNKINFLICSKNVSLGPDFDPLIQETIKDSQSGESFVLLKNP